jgi:hypothetical protein
MDSYRMQLTYCVEFGLTRIYAKPTSFKTGVRLLSPCKWDPRSSGIDPEERGSLEFRTSNEMHNQKLPFLTRCKRSSEAVDYILVRQMKNAVFWFLTGRSLQSLAAICCLHLSGQDTAHWNMRSLCDNLGFRTKMYWTRGLESCKHTDVASGRSVGICIARLWKLVDVPSPLEEPQKLQKFGPGGQFALLIASRTDCWFRLVCASQEGKTGGSVIASAGNVGER